MENEGFAKVRIENEGDTNGRRWNLFIPSVAFIASVLLGGMCIYMACCDLTPPH